MSKEAAFWDTLGVARYRNAQWKQAIVALEKSAPHAGELADYVRYLLALSYAAEGNSAKAVELLHGFQEKYPESILQREAAEVYGSALLAQGKPEEAIAVLEAHRTPAHATVELALGTPTALGEPPQPARTRLASTGMTIRPRKRRMKTLMCIGRQRRQPTGSFDSGGLTCRR